AGVLPRHRPADVALARRSPGPLGSAHPARGGAQPAGRRRRGAGGPHLRPLGAPAQLGRDALRPARVAPRRHRALDRPGAPAGGGGLRGGSGAEVRESPPRQPVALRPAERERLADILAGLPDDAGLAEQRAALGVIYAGRLPEPALAAAAPALRRRLEIVRR